MFKRLIVGFIAAAVAGVNIVNAWTGYQVGSSYEYEFAMNVDVRGQTPSSTNDDGMVASAETRTNQIYTDGAMVVRCLERDSSNYLLEMEIVNVRVKQVTHQEESIEDIGARNHRELNSQITGKRAVFVQGSDGGIIDIIETPDSKSSSFSWLYRGLINSFQTHLVGERDVNGRWMVADGTPVVKSDVLVDDITGVHTVDVTRTVDNGRHLIIMEYDEDDYMHFTDKRVDKNTVDVEGVSKHWENKDHGVSDEIHVYHSSRFESSQAEETDLGASGIMRLKLRNVHTKDRRRGDLETSILKQRREHAVRSSGFPIHDMDADSQLERTRRLLKEFTDNPSDDILQMHMLGLRFAEFPSHVFLIEQTLDKPFMEEKVVKKALIHALVNADTVEAQNILIRKLMDSPEAVIMSSMFTNPSRLLIDAVKKTATKETEFVIEAMEAKSEGRFEEWKAAQRQSVTPHADGFDKQKSGSWSKSVGPKDLHVDLAASYFAGTDFTACGGGSGTDLNVKVGATASATASIFGHSKSVIDLNAWYVIMAGQTVQNSYSLSVFGHTVTNGKVFPYEGKACPPHVSKNIWSASPGFSVTYTMVVVAVPVQFSAGITAQLNLAYGYDICPQDLKASVDLEPGVTVVASATAQVSLVLAHAGITLAGSINQQVRPTAFINMNGNCQLGAKVDLVAAPTTLRFYGFYGYRSCSFHHWRLRCGWHDSSHDFWSWQNSGSSSTVWSDTCYFNRHSSPMFSCGH